MTTMWAVRALAQLGDGGGVLCQQLLHSLLPFPQPGLLGPGASRQEAGIVLGWGQLGSMGSRQPTSKRGTRVTSSGLWGTILKRVLHNLPAGPQKDRMPLVHRSDPLFNKS